MTRKNNYAALDDIGFVGVDDKRSKAQRDEDAKRTSEYIRKYLSKKNVSLRLSTYSLQWEV